MKSLRIITAFLFFLPFINGCKKDQVTVATLQVKLKDSPAVYQQVNIEVTGAEIHTDAGGWISIPVQTNIYNVLLLKDSVNATLGILQLPSGNISQVRLILGANNSVMVAGAIYPLSLSSEDETGLKLNVHQQLTAGI